MSRVLSDLISNFVTTSDLIANKRRFKNSRLAKIIVDSILTFEWTHNQVQESALKLNNLIVSSTMDGHESCKGDLLLESLSTIVNKKLQYHGNKSKATILIDCIWNDAVLDGKVQSCMIERVC